MTFSPRAIEAAGQVLRERDMSGRITVPWGKVPKSQRKKWIERGEAALTAALAVDGVALVPVEPTAAMLDAGEETFVSGYSGTPISTPRAVWSAMLAAASDREERR
jgi:hypothetical protein